MLQINSLSLQSGSWTQLGLIISFSKFFNPNIKYQNLKNEKKKEFRCVDLVTQRAWTLKKKKQPSPCTRNFIFFYFLKSG
jgi:hypothetical protein